MADRPHRRKVTLEWSHEDVLEVYASQLRPGENGKYMELPSAHYSAHPYDMVMKDGKMAGFSTYPCLLMADRRWISLATVDASVADTGTEVTVIWGEPNGGSSKPGVERHYLKEIRAKTAPWPYVQFARENYRPRK